MPDIRIDEQIKALDVQFAESRVEFNLNFQELISIYGKSIKSIELVGDAFNSDPGAENTYRVIRDDDVELGTITTKNYALTEDDKQTIVDAITSNEAVRNAIEEAGKAQTAASEAKESAKGAAEAEERIAGKESELTTAISDAIKSIGESVQAASDDAGNAKEYSEIAYAEAEKAKRYYVPSIDAEGNLSWTPTNGDMAELETKNVYGDVFLQAVDDIEKVKLASAGKVGYAKYNEETSLLEFYSSEDDDEPLFQAGPVRGGAGSGGGGGSSISKVTITPQNFGTTETVAYGEETILRFSWSSEMDGSSTGNGSMSVRVNGSYVINNREVSQNGVVSVDVTQYLLPNKANEIRIYISDIYNSSNFIRTTYTTIDLGLTAESFNETLVRTTPFTFYCIPSGAGLKTIHYSVDGVELEPVETMANGRREPKQIPLFGHGAHDLKAWAVMNVNGKDIPSAPLSFTYIEVDEEQVQPIVAMRFNETELKQYYTYNVRYQVWAPGMTAEVTLDDGDSVTVNPEYTIGTEGEWAVRKDVQGGVTLSISCGDVVASRTVQVVDSGIVLNPVQGAEMYLTSKGHVKGGDLEWSWNGIDVEFSDTFNKENDGWQNDEAGIPVLRLVGDDTITIPVTPFGKDIRTNGKTIEFEFATRDVFDYDAVIMSCLSGGIGIEATAQAVTIHSNMNEIHTQYKEDEHVRISFVISNNGDPLAGRIVYCYINGVMSGAYQYDPTDELFTQNTPAYITIGTTGCTTDVYCLRVYDQDISRYDIVENWLADIQDGGELLRQYQANQVYDNGVVTMEKVSALGIPYLLINGPLPVQKTPSGAAKPIVSGRYVDPLDSSKSFQFSNSTIDVQGTSSAGYPRKNYKIKFSGFAMESGTVAGKYSINGGIPTNTFTFKADYASSEGANNVELARLYEDVVAKADAPLYRTPPQIEDKRYRQGIDGFPILIFNNAGDGAEFIGKYNFNYDKGTPEVYGFTDYTDGTQDEGWESGNNNSDATLFWGASFSNYNELGGDYELIYPKEDNIDKDSADAVANLKEMIEWVASTDRYTHVAGEDGHIVETLRDDADARLQKFKDEFDQHFVKGSLLAYYVFTEHFLMVDSRAKNMLPTFFQEDGKWCIRQYDMDTAIGIDNGGVLRFGYDLEDGMVVNGADVYNAQKSALWRNFKDAFADDIATTYASMRNAQITEVQDDGTPRVRKLFTFEDVEKRFDDHQSKWPVAIWNEDAYYKYVEPLVGGDGRDYLYMLQGKKESQRKWWLYNRFRYDDSRYNAGTAQESQVSLRAYANNAGDHSTFTITPYADIYARVKMGDSKASAKANKGETVVLDVYGNTTVNDLETYIYSADQLRSVGDLSGLLPGAVDVAMATRLQYLKVGSAAEGYDNPHLERLGLGANKLLKVIDARNCSGLSTGINASECTALEEVYFEGTNIMGLTLPNGGSVRVVHLPASITTLNVRNQNKITDLQVAGAENIESLWIENTTDEVYEKGFEILRGMPAGSRVRFTGINLDVNFAEFEGFLDKLGTFKGIGPSGEDQANCRYSVSGRIHLDQITMGAKLIIERDFPGLEVTADAVSCRVRFWSEDGMTLLEEKYVAQGASAAYSGATPSNYSNNYLTATFSGWADQPSSDIAINEDAEYVRLGNVQGDINAYAYFNKVMKTYTVEFKNQDGSVLYSTTMHYMQTPVYAGSPPVYAGPDPEDYGDFQEWTPNIGPVTGNTVYTANFIFTSGPLAAYLKNKLTEYDDSIITSFAQYAFANQKRLKKVITPNVKSIAGNIFQYSTSLEEVDFSGAETLSSQNFLGGNNIKKLDLPSIKTLGSSWGDGLSSLEEIWVRTPNCVLQSSVPSSVKKIVVPAQSIDYYKSATNWSNKAEIIYPALEVAEWLSLEIDADDVSGRAVRTKIRYSATAYGKDIFSGLNTTATFTGEVMSEEFPQNTSETDTVQRTITFTYNGLTATTTITQGVWIDSSVELSLAESSYPFVEDTVNTVPGYTVYKSTNQGKDSTQSIAKLTFIGYTDYTLYIRSYGESNYDYAYVTSINSSSKTQESWTTRGKPNNTSSIDGYTAVQLTGLNDGDFVYVGYRKDSSSSNNPDTGWFLIED